MKAIEIHRQGGPEVFQWMDRPDPILKDDEILIRQMAIGLNFIDVYRRSGLYPIAMPAIIGSEGAGVVEAVGRDVGRFKIGDRAAYAGGFGAYAEKVAVAQTQAVILPETVSFRTAAAVMLKGMTAQVLTRLWPLAAGDIVLVHAAAGGVGGLLTQWLKHLGVKVIATVGSAEKSGVAKANGCDHVIRYDHEDVASAVRAITGGDGVKVVYDAVGKATFEASMSSIAKRGLIVSYGNASGPVAPFAPLRLSQAGSIFFTRPTVFDFIATPEALDQAASDLFHMIALNAVKVEIGQEWPLADVAKAHAALEARQTQGSSLLIP